MNVFYFHPQAPGASHPYFVCLASSASAHLRSLGFRPDRPAPVQVCFARLRFASSPGLLRLSYTA